MRIRPETHADIDAIRRLNDVAFDGPLEGHIVDGLRAAARPFISLVAEDDGEIVGHICFSPVEVERPDGTRTTILGLAPMAVMPERQKQGIGSKLIEHGLNACRATGTKAVVVLGHPDYYPRFGFVPAAPRGLRSEYDVPDPVFMLLEFESGVADDLHGLARYHQAFSDATS
ncbi:MAG TPA: N-acetyltransferase [Thermoanaerobaculia bacterium]|nr:N-acetyltransferase [Thermoanaerobaculia bacterium]